MRKSLIYPLIFCDRFGGIEGNMYEDDEDYDGENDSDVPIKGNKKSKSSSNNDLEDANLDSSLSSGKFNQLIDS